MARSFQKELDQIAEKADTSTPAGLSYVLTGKTKTYMLLDFTTSGLWWCSWQAIYITNRHELVCVTDHIRAKKGKPELGTLWLLRITIKIKHRRDWVSLGCVAFSWSNVPNVSLLFWYVLVPFISHWAFFALIAGKDHFRTLLDTISICVVHHGAASLFLRSLF